MAWAGLWESFVWPDGRVERTFCVITTAAAGPFAEIHDRVPVVLEPADWPLWLGEVDGDPASLLHAPAEGVLRWEPVGASGRSGRRAGHV
jgi:putative SOS response-associated peptidase YedK